MPIYYILGGILVVILSGLYTVNQGTIVVITLFGKYKRTAAPGLRLKIPFLEKVYKRISSQNQSIEMEFQAVTIDKPMCISRVCFCIRSWMKKKRP
jgi:regulator of protease activity HflC (stomatin/prohibitin superfamily)